MSDYDCTADVLKHRERVSFWIGWIVDVLLARAKQHDESKLHLPEKGIYDEFVPKLNTVEFGSDEYRSNLEQMGEGLKHHYQHNRHHPEHYPNGISGMAIWDLIEMLADWMAAASTKSSPIDLDKLQERFAISPQLWQVFAMTLYDADIDAINNNIPPEFQQFSNFLSSDAAKKMFMGCKVK